MESIGQLIGKWKFKSKYKPHKCVLHVDGLTLTSKVFVSKEQKFVLIPN